MNVFEKFLDDYEKKNPRVRVDSQEKSNKLVKKLLLILAKKGFPKPSLTSRNEIEKMFAINLKNFTTKG